MRSLIALLLFLSAYGSSFAQSSEEVINRSVFNRIEFFVNTTMGDSIYHLASDKFKEEVPKDQFDFALNNLYQLGQIKNVETTDFKGRTGFYLLTFEDSTYIEAQLTLDSAYHFDGLLFKPAEKPLPVEDKEEVISEVVKTSPMDFFIDSVAHSYVRKQDAQSLAIGIFHQNGYKTYFYGETEEGNNTLPTENTLYETGSITKVFTAVLLADLVNKDSIQLDGSIAPYLPDSVAANPAIQQITFQSLANHTSGLPRLPDNLAEVKGFDASDPYAHYDTAALYAFLKAYKAGREVGEQYEYSNLGYGLLGQLLSAITGKPYMEILRQNILTPLQMVNTTDKPNNEKQQLVKVYTKNGKQTTVWNFQAMLAAGGLKSTVKDLMLFAVEQFKMPENDLQEAMALTRLFTFATPDMTDIGLAWHMRMLDGLIYVYHGGGTGGSSSFIGLSPDTKSAIVVLSNAEKSVDQISITILEKLLSEGEVD